MNIDKFTKGFRMYAVEWASSSCVATLLSKFNICIFRHHTTKQKSFYPKCKVSKKVEEIKYFNFYIITMGLYWLVAAKLNQQVALLSIMPAVKWVCICQEKMLIGVSRTWQCHKYSGASPCLNFRQWMAPGWWQARISMPIEDKKALAMQEMCRWLLELVFLLICRILEAKQGFGNAKPGLEEKKHEWHRHTLYNLKTSKGRYYRRSRNRERGSWRVAT